MGKEKIICVIPARMGSTRFPGKMLAPLGGKPLVQWAYEGAKNTGIFDIVTVAVDSKKLFDAVESFGGKALMTSCDCKSGTERLVEIRESGVIQGDIWVNWQGDEPFITKEAVRALLQSIKDKGQNIWTLKRSLAKEEEVSSPDVVKVVTDREGKALYFSRSVIPYRNHGKTSEAGEVFGHVGLYAYRDEILSQIGELCPAKLETTENLEQLRLLYHGLSVYVHQTEEKILGIDTKEELAIAELICYTSH